jgi:hypothetical protein
MLATPRKPPNHPLLRSILAQPSRAALHHFTSNQYLDLTPPSPAGAQPSANASRASAAQTLSKPT